MKEVIKVIDLKKYYDDVKAVDGISFEVFKGEVLAILGPNGAGKTTTIEILEGLRKANSGQIYFFGERVQRIDEKIKERIGVQLQSTSFLENLTVKETIDFFGGLYQKRLPTSQLIETVSLQEKAKSLVKNLSGGQLQRLALATALVNDPEIIFLDEPTTGLDPQARMLVWENILKLKNSGKTVILTTHYMEEAEKLADRVIIIDHGKIIAKGTVEELIRLIHRESFIEFSINSPNHDEFLNMFSELRRVESSNKYVLPASNVEKNLMELMEKAKEKNIEIDNIVIRRANLEDVFLSLTGHSLRD
ncbi:MAG: type transport system ATP-binding protein [Pseudothermotoga sp.]|jgi:ABC-2 type transport system ATP-binding protein|nr:type transport system ATP-binding protein [Pseudothermotoga sp.]